MTGICKPNTTGKTHVVHNLQIWQGAEKKFICKAGLLWDAGCVVYITYPETEA
jgi:hypothetical protein